MTSGFHTQQQAGIAVWTFNRPEARNAIDEKTVDELSVALERAECDASLRALILTGSDSVAFVSGADLKFLRDAPPERRARNDARMLDLMNRLEALPVPVIAALNGAAIGGGTEVALACDMRIAEPHCSFTMKHASLGIAPGWGGLGRLSNLVGRSTAIKLLLTALPMPAEEALRVGLVDELVTHGQAKARALELAQAVTRLAPIAVAEIKRLLNRTYREGAEHTRDAERALYLTLASGDDHREALQALFDKRTPSFRARSH